LCCGEVSCCIEVCVMFDMLQCGVGEVGCEVSIFYCVCDAVMVSFVHCEGGDDEPMGGGEGDEQETDLHAGCESSMESRSLFIKSDRQKHRVYDTEMCAAS